MYLTVPLVILGVVILQTNLFNCSHIGVGKKFFCNQRKEAICAVLHLHLHESKKLAEMRDCCVSVCPRPCPWDAGVRRNMVKPRAREAIASMPR